MAVGPDGFLYTANYVNSTIYRYDQQGNQSVFASRTGLSIPYTLAFDTNGLLYVANR